MVTNQFSCCNGRIFFSASRTASIAWKKNPSSSWHNLRTLFFSSSCSLYVHWSSSVFFIFFFIRYETFPFHFAFFGFLPTFTPEKLKNSSRSSEFTQILKKNTKHSTNIDQLPIFSRKFPSFCLIIPPWKITQTLTLANGNGMEKKEVNDGFFH